MLNKMLDIQMCELLNVFLEVCNILGNHKTLVIQTFLRDTHAECVLFLFFFWLSEFSYNNVHMNSLLILFDSMFFFLGLHLVYFLGLLFQLCLTSLWIIKFWEIQSSFSSKVH